MSKGGNHRQGVGLDFRFQYNCNRGRPGSQRAKKCWVVTGGSQGDSCRLLIAKRLCEVKLANKADAATSSRLARAAQGATETFEFPRDKYETGGAVGRGFGTVGELDGVAGTNERMGSYRSWR